MSKRRRNRQQKTTRKKHHHTHDASLPEIDVTPNIGNTAIPYLPRVIADCDKRISRRIVKKIHQRLRFADPHDLRYLSCIRIVNPSAITLPSKETTSGCYQPKWKHQQPEIWLSTDLFTFPGIKWTLFNLALFHRDRLFDTLFHELGHHKASHIRLVSNYKQEAYAEKYLQAYQDAWRKYHRPTRIIRYLSEKMLSVFANRYVMFVYCFFVRNRNTGTQQMYRLYKQFIFRKITQDEFSQQMDAMVDHIGSARKKRRKKRKWEHPLHKQEYRDKFRLDE